MPDLVAADQTAETKENNMIRLKLTTGETVETNRHTYEQAIAAKDAGTAIEVGGPQELGWAEGTTPDQVGEDGYDWPPAQTIYPVGIAAIEAVS